MKHSLPNLLVVLVSVSLAVDALAQANPNVRFALHARPFTKSQLTCPGDGPGALDPNTQGLGCENYNVTAPVGEGAMVYLVVARGDVGTGIQSASFGISYNPDPSQGLATDYVTWTSCAETWLPGSGEYGSWPRPGAGLVVMWDACQKTTLSYTGVHAVAGSFYTYAYSEDVMSVAPRPGGELAVGSCNGSVNNLLETTPEEYLCFLNGAVQFGGNGSKGLSPCWDFFIPCPTPVAPISWGRIKSLYIGPGSP